MFVIVIAVREKVWNCNRAVVLRINSQPFCDEQPVEICADCQTNDCPADIGEPSQQCQTWQAHQQIAAHVRGFRTHGGDDWPQLSAA